MHRSAQAKTFVPADPGSILKSWGEQVSARHVPCGGFAHQVVTAGLLKRHSGRLRQPADVPVAKNKSPVLRRPRRNHRRFVGDNHTHVFFALAARVSAGRLATGFLPRSQEEKADSSSKPTDSVHTIMNEGTINRKTPDPIVIAADRLEQEELCSIMTLCARREKMKLPWTNLCQKNTW
jgi:hypothetical protein